MDRWRHYLLPGVEIGEGKTIGDAREKTRSRYFRENTFKRLKGGNKELLIVSGAPYRLVLQPKRDSFRQDRNVLPKGFQCGIAC